LPKAVWDKLSKKEKQEAERIREEASKQGIQHVEWTPAIKRAMQEYEEESEHRHEDHPEGKTASQGDKNLSKEELQEQAKELNISGRSKMNREELLEAIQQVHD
jgi:Rho termination factor, N-terminal domain